MFDLYFYIPLQYNQQAPENTTATDSIVPTDELISFGESASSMNKADNQNLENGKIYRIQSLVILKIRHHRKPKDFNFILFYRLNKPWFDEGY